MIDKCSQDVCNGKSFYIAASLSEVELARSVSETLQEKGWINTYDWTIHCSNTAIDEEMMRKIAEHESSGVRNADIVIILNPKGRGTHMELGMALALNKKVYLYNFDDLYLKNMRDTVSFYWLPYVTKLSGDINKAISKIISENQMT